MKEYSYLKSKNLSIKDLEKQYNGRKLGELVLHHIKVQDTNQLKKAISELTETIHPELIETTKKFVETIIYGFAKSKDFWKHDCGEALKVYTTATRVEAEKHSIKINDDYTFDIFNLIVLSLAHRAAIDPDFKNFIKKSIRKYWIF